MPQEELKEIKEATPTKVQRNEKEDYTPEKDGKKLQTFKAYDIEFDNGDKGVTRTNKDEPKFKQGEKAHYKTKLLTSDKNPDWSKKIFTYHNPNPYAQSMWADVTFRSQDLYLKSMEMATNMIVLLKKQDEIKDEKVFGEIVKKIYQTIKQNTAEDNKKERLLYQSFWAVMTSMGLLAFDYKDTKSIINAALDLYNKVLKIEG